MREILRGLLACLVPMLCVGSHRVNVRNKKEYAFPRGAWERAEALRRIDLYNQAMAYNFNGNGASVLTACNAKLLSISRTIFNRCIRFTKRS